MSSVEFWGSTLTPIDTDTLKRIGKACPILYVGVLLGFAMSTFAFLGTAVPMLLGVVGLLSGPAVAVYGTMLFAPRDVRFRTILSAIAFILVGLTHLAWMFAFLNLLAPIARSPLGGFGEGAGLVAITGLVFGGVIGIITSSARALGAMLAGTLLATAATNVLEPVMPDAMSALGPGISILHLTITGTLLATTLAWLWPRFRPGACPACGFNLMGNVVGVCPECGFIAPHHPRREPPMTVD